MPTFDAPVGWPPGERLSYVNGAFTTDDTVTMPSFRAMSDGYRAALLTSILMACASKGSQRNVRYYLGGAYSASTALGVASSAIDHSISVSAQIGAGVIFHYGMEVTGAFYVGTQSGSSTPVSARFTYLQCPVAPSIAAISGVGQTGLTVNWSAPSDNGGSAITGYRVEIAKDAAFTVGKQTFDVGVVTSKAITGLLSSTKYWARVYAKNAVTSAYGRLSPVSNVASATTLAGTPNAPGGTTTTVITSQVTRIDWVTPTSDGGSPITGYDLDYSQSATFASGVTTVALGVVNTWTSPTLAVGTWYFRVRGKNANGNGAYGSTVSNVVSAILGYIKTYISGAPVKKPVKVYLTGAWVVKPLKAFVSGIWKTIS